MENENGSLSDIREIKESLVLLTKEIARQGERLSLLEKGRSAEEAPDAFTRSLMGIKEEPVSSVFSSLPPPPPPPLPAMPRSVDEEEDYLAVSSQESGVLPPPPLRLREDDSFPVKDLPFAVSGQKTSGGGISSSTVVKIEDSRDFEEKMGITWFSRIGMFALILGASFFLKYAFDNNWIGPTGRVLIGIVVGIALLGVGEKFIKKYFDYGQLIVGGGLSVLYLSLYAALNFYHLIPQATAFGFMAFVTVIGALLSVRYDAKNLMVFTVLGGFLTPMLVSSGTNQQFEYFSYLLILDLGIFGVSLFKRWHDVQFIGFLCTLIAFSGWSSSFYSPDQLWPTFVFATLFFLVYSLSALAYNLLKKEASTGMEQTLTLLAGIAYFATSYGLLDEKYHAYMGFFALILAIYYFLFANVCKTVTTQDSKLYNFLALLSVGFITLAIPLQFKTNIITLSWFVEAVLLTYAAIESKNYILKQLSVVVTLLPIARLLVLDFDMSKTGMLILNERFFTYLFGIVALYLIAYLWKQDTESGESRKLANIATLTANFFTLVAGSLEISYHFANARVMELSDLGTKSRYDSNYTILNNLSVVREGIILSIYWLSYAVINLAIGIFGKLRHIRLSGFVLLVFALIKYTIADSWRVGELPTAERFGVYAFIIAVLYIVAYLWSKYEEDMIQAKKLVAVFAIFANLFTLYAGSMEITYHYDALIRTENAQISQNYQINTYSGSQNYNASVEYKQIDKLNNKESVTLSIFWILYAVLLLAVGITKKIRYVRLFGLFLLSFAIVKLFIYDLWGLGTLYRIISSMTLGVVLLAVSYAYQRFKDQIKTII